MEFLSLNLHDHCTVLRHRPKARPKHLSELNCMAQWGQILFKFELKFYVVCNAIPYRASTGQEQGFPCVVFPRREKLVFIVGFPVDENRFFPVGNTTQGKPCFHYREPLFPLQGPCIHYRNFPVRITTQGDSCSHYREWVCSVRFELLVDRLAVLKIWAKYCSVRKKRLHA